MPSEDEEQRVFGESLPPGLRLVEEEPRGETPALAPDGAATPPR
jgi:hypothetical protein